MADIVTSKQFVNGQLGVDGSDLNGIMNQAVIQPAFYSAKSIGNAPGNSDSLLLLSSGGSYYQIPYSSLFNNGNARLASGLPQWSTVINGDFEIWQRGTSPTQFLQGIGATAGSNTYYADRWCFLGPNSGSNTAVGNVSRVDLGTTFTGGANNPRTRYAFRVTVGNAGLTTPLASDYLTVSQKIEYVQARKLFDNASSLSLWLRASVAGTYSIVIQSADQSQTYKQDFNIGTPNVFQRVTMPNIPAMPTGAGNWGSAETDLSYMIHIVLMAGTTYQNSGMSTWLSGNYLASATSSQPLFTANNNTLDIALVQHESGIVCTPFQPERSYGDQLLKCQRYYAQTYDDIAGNFAGSTTDNNFINVTTNALTSTNPGVLFPTLMRTVPTVIIYSPATGTSGKVSSNSGDKTVSSITVGRKAVSNIALGVAAPTWMQYHYTSVAEL